MPQCPGFFAPPSQGRRLRGRGRDISSPSMISSRVSSRQGKSVWRRPPASSSEQPAEAGPTLPSIYKQVLPSERNTGVSATLHTRGAQRAGLPPSAGDRGFSSHTPSYAMHILWPRTRRKLPSACVVASRGVNGGGRASAPTRVGAVLLGLSARTHGTAASQIATTPAAHGAHRRHPAAHPYRPCRPRCHPHPTAHPTARRAPARRTRRRRLPLPADLTVGLRRRLGWPT